MVVGCVLLLSFELLLLTFEHSPGITVKAITLLAKVVEHPVVSTMFGTTFVPDSHKPRRHRWRRRKTFYSRKHMHVSDSIGLF